MLIPFYCFFLTHTHAQDHRREHAHSHTQPHTFPSTTVAFPAVYQTNVWVVFSSTGLNILFHFPVSHCLTHKHTNTCLKHTLLHTHTRACMQTHTPSIRCSPHALARRDSAPCSKSKRLMCLLGQNEIVCHYKALYYRTPE